MINVDDIKAGKYQLIAKTWDEPTSKPGEPFDFVRHREGDVVELDVEEARRLVSAGAVVKPGELERQRAAAAKLAYEAALAMVPEELRDQVADDPDDAQSAGGNGDGGDGGDELDITANTDTVLKWVGDDPARAEEALTAETGEGGKNRSGLTEKLAAVISAAGS